MSQRTDPIRLAVVNDYEVVVAGVAAMLRNYSSEVSIVDLDATGETEVASPADVALFDTFAHGQGTCPAVQDLMGESTVKHVAIYSWNVGDELVQQSLEQGVSGYLSKALSAAELVDALRRITDGERVVEPQPMRSNSSVGGDWPGREEGLTPRESEVIALITQGLSNEKIAELTALSPNSVKSYIRGAYRKLGLTSRTRAVLWGVEHGFVPDRRKVD